MVNDVPDIVERVEYTQRGERLPEELEQRRSARRQRYLGEPDPLRRAQRNNDQQLVPDGVRETEPRVRPRRSYVRVDLVPVNQSINQSIIIIIIIVICTFLTRLLGLYSMNKCITVQHEPKI